MNPTQAVPGTAPAEMEGGIASLPHGIWHGGDHRIDPDPSPRRLQHHQHQPALRRTYNLFAHTFRARASRCVSHRTTTAPLIESLIDDKTRALFCESIGNPAGNVVDIAPMG